MSRRSGGAREERDPAKAAFKEGVAQLRAHPAFGRLVDRAYFVREPEASRCPPDGWAVVYSDGEVHVHPTRRGTAEEWAFVLGHALLHLAFGHFRADRLRQEDAWVAACDVVVHRFLTDLKVGRPPEELALQGPVPATDQDRLYERFLTEGVPNALDTLGTAGPAHRDMVLVPERTGYHRRGGAWWSPTPQASWEELFALGLQEALQDALERVAGVTVPRGPRGERREASASERARRWFVDHYPLLGALAAGFRLVEDARVCHRMDIQVAAVSAQLQEVYVNPNAALDEEEWRFVLAHEFLHVALHHWARGAGRDPYLWNIAADFVTNAWLRDMKVGRMPASALYDATFDGLSMESVYDAIVRDARRMRRLATFRGGGLGDILDAPGDRWWAVGEGMLRDEYYRRAIASGLDFHAARNRGLLPAGLVEAIQALSYPPIPWDVSLGDWFQEQFPRLERRRTYAVPSRRQSASPTIPRPRWMGLPADHPRPTFGVVLDTSGSMDRALLAAALGAIASYAEAHDVPAVRLVYCDAHPYDEGWVEPIRIADERQVRGRGGTVLQPAIDLLEAAEDFPADAPILIITDAACDVLRIRRTHGFLIPPGVHLPFVPAGPVFRLTD